MHGPLVRVHDGIYHVSAEWLVHAPVSRVFAALTDYRHLGRLNPEVRKSRILGFPAPGHTLVQMVIRSCILFICFHVRQTDDMTAIPDREIDGRIVPRLSNLRYGYARWRLAAQGDATRIHFTSAVEPDFFIPPLIGPFLLRGKLRHEIRVTLRGLNACVQDPHTASARSQETPR
ncbi:MAG: SRPBCC family protein [Gammaproteobacteria bacterium]|nr:SRPBCC family protein [Gammaproteobacteria bacterium]